ncbi:hypothetical protein Tco_0401586 [Tanacetum coccineum]
MLSSYVIFKVTYHISGGGDMKVVQASKHGKCMSQQSGACGVWRYRHPYARDLSQYDKMICVERYSRKGSGRGPPYPLSDPESAINSPVARAVGEASSKEADPFIGPFISHQKLTGTIHGSEFNINIRVGNPSDNDKT